jgi:MOSC domain-containing protein YiiM
MKARLQSIQIGQVRTYSDDQGSWETSFFKEPVCGPISLGSLGLEGDDVANKKHHGGPDQAVLLYSENHYHPWKSEYKVDFPFGAFAENLTIDGMDETSVFIGDIYKVGVVKLQVTKPRIPCWKITRRWGIPNLTKRVTQTKRTGWYCRVLQGGQIEAGIPIELLWRPEDGQTVAQAFQVYLKSA